MVSTGLTKSVKKILGVESVMLGRSIVMFVVILAALPALVGPALAGELKPEDARRFIAGKYFSYTCFEGSSGAGRINTDGSVVGTIQVRGAGPTHFVALPTGTVRVQPDSICASLRGIPFQPCFSVQQTDAKSFRGSVLGLGFAYCDFTRRNPRLEVSAPPSLHPATDLGMMRTSISE